LGQIRPHRKDEAWSASLWQTFFSSCVDANVPALAELPLSACGCRKFQIDTLGDHLCTCTGHSGAKKAHDWAANDIDRSLNEAAADKIRKYRADYSNNPPNAISFMPAIGSTSGRIHSEFVRLLFLQAHRETDRFFEASGVQLAEHKCDQFNHYLRAAFSSQLKSKIGNILAKAAALRITLNIDGAPLTSRSRTHPSHSQTSRLVTSSLSLGVPVPRTTQCIRDV
jgi:hypothetical protein